MNPRETYIELRRIVWTVGVSKVLSMLASINNEHSVIINEPDADEIDYLDIDKCLKFLEMVEANYLQTATSVATYAAQLQKRLKDDQPVQLQELIKVRQLYAEGLWLAPKIATNLINHLQVQSVSNLQHAIECVS